MNINEAKKILRQNGYILESNRKHQRYIRRMMLREAGIKAPILKSLNEAYLYEGETEQINNFKKQFNTIAAQSLKLKQKKQTDDVQKREKELTQKSLGFLSKIRSNKWSKRAYTALRLLTVAAGLLGAPTAGMEDNVIEFDTDHGAYELSNDGVQYFDNNGDTIFTYNPDNGDTKFAVELNDKQLNAINADLDNTVKEIAQDNEINLDNVNIHGGFVNNNSNNHVKQAATDDDELDLSKLDKLEKLHDIKQKLGLDDINDVQFAHLIDPDYVPSDKEIDSWSEEEAGVYLDAHPERDGGVPFDDDFSRPAHSAIKNGQKFLNTIIANNGAIPLTELLDGEKQMNDYMNDHNHEITPNEALPIQYMRAYLMDNGVSEDKIDQLNNSELETTYSDVRSEIDYKHYIDEFITATNSELNNDNDSEDNDDEDDRKSNA